MENFQLYSTNILLGGNMKYDLILDSNGSVSDFHITPISDKLPYNKYSDDDLMNFPHYENVRKYYEEIQGQFYKEYIDPQLSHDWPIDDELKAYDDTFIMGCKRAQYNIYKKQFEFFCPLWLEKINDSIEFIIGVYSESDQFISSKTIKITGEFQDYIENYIKYIGLDKGDDNIMFVDFANKHAVINGLEVNSGNVITKDVSQLVDNLLYRERPLMEFDSMIINAFKDNKIIAKQLFNFNICFNIEDVLSGFLKNILMDHKIKIKVSVKIDGKNLELRDFYTNYETIKKPTYIIKSLSDILNQQSEKNENVDKNAVEKFVLDYLNDNKNIDLINKNKIPQKYFHWSLKENPDYIFNTYEGFSGILTGDKYCSHYSGENTKYCSHYYGVTGDLINGKESKDFIPWLNTYYVKENDIYDIYNFMYYHSKTKDLYSDLNKAFINNFKYKNNDSLKNMKAVLVKIDFNEDGKTKFEEKFDAENDVVFLKNALQPGFFMIISYDYKYLTFNYIKNVLQKVEDEYLKDLNTFMNNLEPMTIVTFNRGLKSTIAEGPSKEINEIQYYKDDNKYSYLVRYDGYIKPSFIKTGNIFYSKKNINENHKKYIRYGFPPLYPSIDYYSYKQDDLKYDEYIYKEYNKYKEYKWFNTGILYNLPISVDLSGIYDNEIDDVLNQYFKDYGDETGKYIKSLYNTSYELLGAENDDLNKLKYKYNIKLNLK